MLSSLLFLDFLYLLLSEKLDSLDDESENNRSDSRSYGTRSFPFCSEDSVGRVSGLGSRVFVPTGVDSKCDVFAFFVFVTIRDNYKGG